MEWSLVRIRDYMCKLWRFEAVGKMSTWPQFLGERKKFT